MDHLHPEDYFRALRGEVPMEVVHRHTRLHLAAVGGDDTMASTPSPDSAADTWSDQGHLPLLPEDERCVSLAHCQAADDLLSTALEAARLAREDLKLLLKLPRKKWRLRVDRAVSRYRDRAFAEALLDEARSRVREAPCDAAEMARLVRPALDRQDGDLLRPWVRVLVARAQAHEANALRVAGELPRAAKIFERLQENLILRPIHDVGALAEIQGLEASLAIDRRDSEGAKRLLEESSQLHAWCGFPLGQAKALVNLANLHQALGEPEAMPGLLDEAATLFEPTEQPYLHFCIVNARLNALLDLDRGPEAGRALIESRDVYLGSGDDYRAALFTAHQARVDFMTGRPDDAIGGFESARDQLLALDRSYDAVLASLYLADALLAADRTEELRELALSLVPMFQSRGVARETLAALRLLAEAARTEAVTARLVARVRDRLGSAVEA